MRFLEYPASIHVEARKQEYVQSLIEWLHHELERARLKLLHSAVLGKTAESACTAGTIGAIDAVLEILERNEDPSVPAIPPEPPFVDRALIP